MLNVEITSRETIKPSSPTPNNLRSMPLSIADQLNPDTYIQAVLFFQTSSAAPLATAALLKESLSKTLDLFYPLAGRLSEDVLHADAHVDCNDEGVEFYEATADGPLDVHLRRPSVRDLCNLMPNGGANMKSGDPLLAVQLNAFTCGGVALGVCISHQVVDSATLALFLNRWGEIARGEPISSPPRFHTASVFPPANLPRPVLYQTAEGLLPNRFVIRGTEIQKLRREAACGRAETPTRVETVTALLWRCVARARPKAVAADVNYRKKRTYRAKIPVNLRRRMRSELSDASFGNLVVSAFVTDNLSEEGAGKNRQASLERAIRDAVTRVDGHFARKCFDRVLTSGQDVTEEDKSVDVMEFSSWCRLPFYRTDFGWGEPAWYCSLMRDLLNLVVLADTKDERGVDAWVWLPEEEMGRLLKDPELLEFVDPQSISCG